MINRVIRRLQRGCAAALVAAACCNACGAQAACGSAIFQPSEQKCFLKPADCTPVHKSGVTSCTPKPSAMYASPTSVAPGSATLGSVSA